MKEIHTGNEVAERLIRMTDKGELYWRENSSRGELEGFTTEYKDVNFRIAFDGASAPSRLLVSSTDVLTGPTLLNVLVDHVRVRIAKTMAAEEELALKRALRDAAEVLEG